MTGRDRYLATAACLLVADAVLVGAFFMVLDPVWSWFEPTFVWNVPEPHAFYGVAVVSSALFFLAAWGVASSARSQAPGTAYWLPPILVHLGFLLCLPSPGLQRAREAIPFAFSLVICPVAAYLGSRLGKRGQAVSSDGPVSV